MIRCSATKPSTVANKLAPGVFEATGKLVVVIDDEPAVLGGLELLLQSLGCETVTTTFQSDPASEIMNLAEACPRRPDLVMVDYGLPFGYTGIDVVGDLRAVFGEDLPAVVLIDEISSEPLAIANESGLPTLRKPLNAEDLLAAIQELIDPSEMPPA
jgi:CheY-like chemotaxis protein